MRRFITIASLSALLAGVSVSVAAAQDVDVQGAWLVTSITDPSGVESEAQPGLFLYTGTHYTMMFVPGSDERGKYEGETQTDDELLEAYATFIANSGRYQVSGDQLSHRAYVAKDRNYMAEFPENALTATVHRAGDTLHWTWNEGFMGGVMFTLTRVEGTPVPWSE